MSIDFKTVPRVYPEVEVGQIGRHCYQGGLQENLPQQKKIVAYELPKVIFLKSKITYEKQTFLKY